MAYKNTSDCRGECGFSENGQELTENARIVSANIYWEVNRISGAVVYLYDGSTNEQEFTQSNAEVFKPGSELEIELGPVGKRQKVFKGIVVRQSIQHRRDHPSLLMVELKHPAVRLTQTRKNAYFEESSDKDILSGLKAEGVTVDADDALSNTYPETYQVNVSDWDYIVSRAEANGCLVYTQEEGKVEVAIPAVDGLSAGDPIVYGDNIVEFEAEIDARYQYKSVVAQSWDYLKQESVVGTAENLPGVSEGGSMSSLDLASILGDGEYQLFHSGQVAGESEMESWAKAKLTKSRLSKIRGRVVVPGTNSVLPGETIVLEGMGDLYNGPVFVSGVRQDFGEDRWLTEIQFGLSPEWFSAQNDVIDIPISGLMPPMAGLQIGTVIEVEEDPAAQQRVQVNLKVMGSDDITIWARVSRPDAGSERGLFVQPRVGDEVVVGFVNQDPRDAIILGALHTIGEIEPPFESTDDYFKTGIKTVNGNMLEFDDETNIITLTTEGGNTLLIDDDEGQIVITDASNTNSITLNSNGITLDSSGDIILKTSSGDISLEGVNITHSATSQFTAEGNGGAELSSTANAVIKGSLVQIN